LSRGGWRAQPSGNSAAEKSRCLRKRSEYGYSYISAQRHDLVRRRLRRQRRPGRAQPARQRRFRAAGLIPV
jgi:hypothetical protein